jgi:Lecithin retinol acyltransferase
MRNFHFLPGDRVVVPKSWFGIVQHHAIYDGKGHFYENKAGFGVVRTPYQDFFRDVESVTEIRRFQGDRFQLQTALARAENLVGKRYHLKDFNCEHFADFVQYGRARSKQVETVLGISALVFTVWAINKLARD